MDDVIPYVHIPLVTDEWAGSLSKMILTGEDGSAHKIHLDCPGVIPGPPR